MNANNRANGKGDFDEIVTVAIVIAFIALLLWLIWFKLHTLLSSIFLYTHLPLEYPFFLLSQIIPLSFLHVFTATTYDVCQPDISSGGFHIIYSCTVDKRQITWQQLRHAAIFWNIVFGAIAVYFTVRGYLRVQEDHPESKFKRSHDLESFIEEHKVNYDHLRVFGDLNMQDFPNDKGPFRGMDTTREFAFKNDLIKGYSDRRIRFIVNGITHSELDPTEKVPVLDTPKLEDLLRIQLGRLWTGLDDISPAETILLSMYLPRACSTDASMSDAEFNKIWAKCLELEGDFWHIAAREIKTGSQFSKENIEKENKNLNEFPINYLKKHFIEPYLSHPVIVKLLKKHAYTRTFIISVIYTARTLGVMAPSSLRWIKLYDRSTWALLQNVGRPSMFSEGMGAISHYTIEVITGEAVVEPNFDIATKGFETQICSFSFNLEHQNQLLSKTSE